MKSDPCQDFHRLPQNRRRVPKMGRRTTTYPPGFDKIAEIGTLDQTLAATISLPKRPRRIGQRQILKHGNGWERHAVRCHDPPRSRRTLNTDADGPADPCIRVGGDSGRSANRLGRGGGCNSRGAGNNVHSRLKIAGGVTAANNIGRHPQTLRVDL